MQSQVILLKHAYPVLIEAIPPKDWLLGDEGKQQAVEVANHFRVQNVRHIVTSREPKAFETARLIGEQIGLEPHAVDGLQEFDIAPRPIMARDQHVAANRKIFDFPEVPALGIESANIARSRFERALLLALENIPLDENVLVVSHGTVISLFAGHNDYEKSFSIWKRLRCLSYVRLNRKGLSVTEIVENPSNY